MTLEAEGLLRPSMEVIRQSRSILATQVPKSQSLPRGAPKLQFYIANYS